MNCITIGAALAALAGTSSAFQTSQLLHGRTYSEPWATGAPETGAFGRAEIGDFSGDGVPDAWLQDGTDAVLLLDVDHTFAPVRVAPAASDLCVVPLHGLDGRDGFAWVDAGGLHAGLLSPVDASRNLRVVDSAAWAGARSVRARDLDADGRCDLVGVAANGQSIVVALATSEELDFACQVAFEALAEASEVVPLQWDGVGALEIAVLTALGVQVHDASGALLASFASTGPVGTIARIAQSSSSSDRLAWIAAPQPMQPQWLRTLSSAGVDGQVDLGGVDVVACIGADSDADGDDDLLISHTESYELVWLENLRSAANPLAESFQVTLQTLRLLRAGPITEEAPENRATPALGDLDGDGDLDVVFGCEGSQELVVVREDIVDEETARPSLSSLVYDVNLGRLSAAVVEPTQGWGDANALVVDAWRRPGIGANNQGVAVDTQTLPIAPEGDTAIVIQLPESTSSFPNLYSLRVRPVRLGAGGVLERSAAPCLGTFAIFASDVDALEAEPYAGATIVVTSGLPEDAQHKTRVIKTSRSRRFTTDQPPVPAPTEN